MSIDKEYNIDELLIKSTLLQKDRLKNVDKRLILLCIKVNEYLNSNTVYKIKITEGMRTKEQQEYLVKTGKSKTLNSKHLVGKAFDICILKNNQITWNFDDYKAVSIHFKRIAKELNISIFWGGDWKSFMDGPHYQIEE